MTRSRTWMAALLALVLLFAAACGGDDDDAADTGTGDATDQASDDAAVSDDDGDDADDDGTTDTDDDAPATGEFGTITINGDVYPVTMLNRCIPFSGSDDDLDLQALGEGVKINIYASAGVVDDVSIDGSTVTSEYGSRAFGGFDSVIADQSTDGGRTTGSATMPDATGGPTTVEVEWDVEIPSDVRDCSL
ncbi:hypothetical protein [Actinospongicola halichondriae]|uniref:hypothetical protein n=1 Tax=Actinospongicola halichondriae TaxID=3236844 RepID=UPI003D3A79CD